MLGWCFLFGKAHLPCRSVLLRAATHLSELESLTVFCEMYQKRWRYGLAYRQLKCSYMHTKYAHAEVTPAQHECAHTHTHHTHTHTPSTPTSTAIKSDSVAEPVQNHQPPARTHLNAPVLDPMFANHRETLRKTDIRQNRPKRKLPCQTCFALFPQLCPER